jgi:ribonuclease III
MMRIAATMPVKSKKTTFRTAPLQEALGYVFKRPVLLADALTHKSYAHENQLENSFGNERLEFLGDAVLELAITHMLIMRYPDYSEGKLSKMRAAIVNSHELARLARTLGIGGYMNLSRGEIEQNGSEKQSILANAYEAVVAAVYCDGGFTKAFAMIERHFAVHIEEAGCMGFARDFKSRLQEYAQKHYSSVPLYTVVTEHGPDHSKQFVVRVSIEGTDFAQGCGSNKKEAEQHAAQQTLMMLTGC